MSVQDTGRTYPALTALLVRAAVERSIMCPQTVLLLTRVLLFDYAGYLDLMPSSCTKCGCSDCFDAMPQQLQELDFITIGEHPAACRMKHRDCAAWLLLVTDPVVL